MILERNFDEIIKMIIAAKENSFLAVNKELIELYWNIGQYISDKILSSGWGKGIVKNLSDYISRKMSGTKWFLASEFMAYEAAL